MSGVRRDLSFWDWLIPLRVTSSWSIHVVARVRTSLLVKAGEHSSVDGPRCVCPLVRLRPLDCFPALGSVSHAAGNPSVQILLRDPAFSSPGCTPKSGITGPHGNCMFSV